MPSFLAIADFFAPAIARTRLNIHLRSEDFVRIVLRGDVGPTALYLDRGLITTP